MPPGIKSDIFEWTIGIGLYTTEDQRSNNPCLVRPGHSEVYFSYYGNPSRKFHIPFESWFFDAKYHQPKNLKSC
jgi:hypothetical protein